MPGTHGTQAICLVTRIDAVCSPPLQPKLTGQVVVQPFASVTVSVKSPRPAVPAVYVIVCPSAPPVIIQPLLLPASDQLYNANPAGPLNVFPVEPQTGSGSGATSSQTGLQLATIVWTQLVLLPQPSVAT